MAVDLEQLLANSPKEGLKTTVGMFPGVDKTLVIYVEAYKRLLG